MTLEALAVKIAANLNATEKRAWRSCQWEGEYFNPPDLGAFGIAYSCKLGLIDRRYDNSVTPKGEALIIYLQNPWWKRALLALRARLLAQKEHTPS